MNEFVLLLKMMTEPAAYRPQPAAPVVAVEPATELKPVAQRKRSEADHEALAAWVHEMSGRATGRMIKTANGDWVAEIK